MSACRSSARGGGWGGSSRAGATHISVWKNQEPKKRRGARRNKSARQNAREKQSACKSAGQGNTESDTVSVRAPVPGLCVSKRNTLTTVSVRTAALRARARVRAQTVGEHAPMLLALISLN